MTKQCKTCKITKDISEFYTHCRTNDGYQSSCKECSKSLARKWHRSNKDKANEKWVSWRKRNASKHNAIRRAKRKNPQHRLASDGRNTLNKILRRKKLFSRWVAANTGCSKPEELINHLKSTIQHPYTFSDYGKTLVIDHIKPCSSFDLTDEKQYKECFNYKNLRIITRTANIKKGNKII